MRKVGWLLLGAASLVAIETLAAAIVLTQARGLSAREEPAGIERWMARRARDAAIPAGARNRTNPIAKTPETLTEARAHWADHCAGCHANDGSGTGTMGKRMYPAAPDMRQRATQNL